MSDGVSVINPLTVFGLCGNFRIMSRARPVNGTKCGEMVCETSF